MGEYRHQSCTTPRGSSDIDIQTDITCQSSYLRIPLDPYRIHIACCNCFKIWCTNCHFQLESSSINYPLTGTISSSRSSLLQLKQRLDGSCYVLIWNSNGPVLGHQELALKVPGRVPSAGFLLEHLPRFSGIRSIHEAFAHKETCRGLRKLESHEHRLFDLRVGLELLPSKLARR